jgi:hypothetical protein
LALLWLAPALPAQAFWPFSREHPVNLDTLTSGDWGAKFTAWKKRPLGADSTAAPAQSLQQMLDAGKIGQGVDSSQLAAMAAKKSAGGGTPPSTSGTAAPGAGSGTATAGTPSGTAPGTGPAAAGTAFSTAAAAPVDSAAVGDSLQAAANPDSATSANAPSGPFSGLRPQLPPPAAIGAGFAPKLDGSLLSNNDRMTMNSTFSAAFADASGVALSSSASYGQDFSLTQNTETDSHGLLLGLNLPVQRYGLNFNISTSNQSTDRFGTRTSGGRTNDSTDDRGATALGSVSHAIVHGFSANGFYSRNFNANETNIVGTQGATSSGREGSKQHQGTGNGFGFGVTVDRVRWMKMRGRWGRGMMDNVDETSSLEGPQNSTSSGDTASASVDLPVGRWLPQLTLNFDTRSGDETYVDVARTSGGSVTSTTDFALETKRTFSRALRLNGRVEPARMLSASFNVEAARDSVSYNLRKNQFQDTKRLAWKLDSTLRYASGGSVRVNLEGSNGDFDQDEPTSPPSPQTRREEARRITGEIQHGFTQTLKARLSGEVGLTQYFYQHVGPQGLGDRDDSRSRVEFGLDGKISSKITARVAMYVRTYDQAFIDRRRSASSRDETEYVVRPSFTYQITPRFNLDQLYGLSSKVVDVVFDPVNSSDPNQDTLNRNHFLQTHWSYKMTERVLLDGKFDYLLQDNGAYPRDPETGARFFAPTARTKQDKIGLGVRFELVKGGKLVFTSNQESTRQHVTGQAGGVTVNETHNWALGLESKMNLGDFSLDCSVQRNQSANVSLNRSVYYNVQSSLSYLF